MAEENKPSAASQVGNAVKNEAVNRGTKWVAAKIATQAVAGAASGGLANAASAAISFANKHKGDLGKIGSGLVAAPFMVGAGLIAMVGAGVAALGSALIIAIIAVPVAVAFFLTIINNSAYMVPPASSYSPISLFEDRIIQNADCPLVNGSLLLGNPMWASYNGSIGHGSDEYWNITGGSCFSYAMPQQTNCHGPIGNACGSGAYSQTCPHYGYSFDVGSITPIVVVPRIGEESVTWTSVEGFSTDGGAYTSIFTDSSGRYTLVISHMDRQVPAGQTFISGTQIGRLGSITVGAPHLHLEFQVDGIWVKPENYFCN